MEGVMTVYTLVLLNMERGLNTYGGNNDAERTNDIFILILCSDRIYIRC